ncbi:lysozyme inhibitor LprI family protein [Dyella tabacisoli]|uniref:DUF1311 domain-containing protein n=1 Tax=Dyella tabacisoli TaxID=2282381 RepID=A0A369UJI2_9GAMM|nr:lysozyme inhibitor LprI family protein [Dyella tabacisoli]RDD80686.1 DUF1311 domain-containing protein [Dyella tabacisoli]
MRLLPLFALFALPLSAYAASFDCGKAASAAEKAICADATLSQQDSDLAAAWKQALARGGDTAALKTSQRDWLKQRDTCGSDTRCLGDSYRRRQQALGAARPSTAVHSGWVQTWELDSDNNSVGGELTFTGTPPHLHFTIETHDGAQLGSIEGDLLLQGDHGSYRSDHCRLDFSRDGNHLAITQKGTDFDCGAGAGVYFAGKYLTASQAALKPEPDLLSLNVLASPAQNSAAHKLLGKEDYQTLVDTIHVQGSTADLDGLGAQVTSYFVRGIANTNAAIVMSHGEQLWIGLLVFDAENQVRMRYYTNVPDWKKRVPKTIQRWHDDNDKNLPIDRMP